MTEGPVFWDPRLAQVLSQQFGERAGLVEIPQIRLGHSTMLDRGVLGWYYSRYNNPGGIPGDAVRIGEDTWLGHLKDGRVVVDAPPATFASPRR